VLRGSAARIQPCGALAIVDADGSSCLARRRRRPIFPRSAVKVLQALPLVESDAADRLQLDDDELALACASHNGEPDMCASPPSMLAKAGVDVERARMRRPLALPRHRVARMAARGETPTALNNNCSGKHAGFVCLGCALRGWNDDTMNLRQFMKGYVAPDHPVMREVTEALQATTGFDLSRAPRGTDGCSIPTFAIPLRHLAHAFARIGSGVGLREGHQRAARRLRAAVAKAPFMVSGTGRFDTRVMERFGERVFCKVGAEGVYCAAFPERGFGVAIKVDDGNNARAAEVVMAAVIEALVELGRRRRRFHARAQRRDAAQLERHRGRCLARVGTLAASAGSGVGTRPAGQSTRRASRPAWLLPLQRRASAILDPAC
jgi:L-asparaginase II